MGTDASLFAVKKKQKFYYDRQYNLFNGLTDHMLTYEEREQLDKEPGLIVTKVIPIIDLLVHLSSRPFNDSYHEEAYWDLLNWLNTLDEDETVFSATHNDDVYWDESYIDYEKPKE